jgi:hypothetical protein
LDLRGNTNVSNDDALNLPHSRRTDR